MTRKTIYLSREKLKLPAKDFVLKEQILSVLVSNPAYGHRRIAIALGVGRKRVRRIMKLYGIKPFKRRRKWIKTHDFGKPPVKYENLIKNSFPLRPQVVYVGDFTYLRWNGNFIYFSTLMDQFTREIVGWNVSVRHTKEFVINTLLDAIKTRGRPYIIHTDQGSEYNSKEFTSFAEKLGIKVSMSKKGCPWENGYQESYYDNFKVDLGLEYERFESLGEFIEAIHQTVNYYNTKRIHTTLKMSPAQFAQKYLPAWSLIIII